LDSDRARPRELLLMTTTAESAVADYRKMLSAIINDVMADMGALNLPEKHMVPGAVYMTIVQSTLECTDLLSKPTITAAGVVRSIFESFADLRALCKERSYGRRMLATFYEQKVKLMKDMVANPSNQYHSSLAEHIDPAKGLQEAQALLDAQKQAGFHQLSNAARLISAGLDNELKSIYWQLCLESHNNIAAIENRHIEDWPDGKHQLCVVKDNRPGELLKLYDTLVTVLIESTLSMHTLAESERVPNWQKWQAILGTFRTKYLQEMAQAKAAQSA
jgi:hypothetical protein